MREQNFTLLTMKAKTFFRTINDAISLFICAGKHPRASRSLLYRDRSAGGLGLPYLIGYYWASSMYKILSWCTSPHTNWCQSEVASCSSSSCALACDTLQSSLLSLPSNPVVAGFWSRIRGHFGWLTVIDAHRHFAILLICFGHVPGCLNFGINSSK